MVNKIVELYQQQLHIYTGDFDFYEQEKLIRIDMQQKAFENQQDYIRQQERFIERFKAKASKAAQAQSVQKRLDKLDKIEDVQLERPDLRINFQLEKIPGKVLVTLKDIGKQFGNNHIVTNASAEIERGDKIALIGANGKGKSTLLRIVAGTEKFTGARDWGHNVEQSFYAQHQLEALGMGHTILEELQHCGSKKTDPELRSLLGAFLFGGDDVDKKIKVLSGGEKARVALAKTIVSKANFLILDEPTNHLDMHSVELLAEALNKYEGSYILVSHDRYFISKTANKIWEIVDQQIKEFKGTYQEWVEWNERMEKQKRLAEQEEKKSPSVKEVKKEAPKPVINNTPINKEAQKELQKMQRKLAAIEEEIEKVKATKLSIEADMGNPSSYADKNAFATLEASYKKTETHLKELTIAYENQFEQLMALEESNL
jgi:ATP-binding cassette subfamily F protein 3